MPLEVLIYPNERLRKVCRPDFVIDGDTVQEMFYLMEEHGGVGLAAPQVGIDARLFVTVWGEVFINPQVHGVGFSRCIQEGCLSIPGRLGVRRRFAEVEVSGRTYINEQALVIQHENDHLNGILCIDKP